MSLKIASNSVKLIVQMASCIPYGNILVDNPCQECHEQVEFLIIQEDPISRFR